MAFNTDKKLEEKFIILRDEYKISTVIETGTYHGDTTEWLCKNFENVYTIEYDERYLNIAKEKLSHYSNVTIFKGRSQDILGDILEKNKHETNIIFLDAHWYENPVIKELDVIKESGTKPIIAIHDFKVPNRPDLGYDIYPEQNIVYDWEWISKKIIDIFGDSGYSIEYNTYSDENMRGCIFILPKKK